MIAKMYKNSRCLINDRYVLERYINGGRGVITLEAPSGQAHTYVFRAPINSSSFPDDVIFVYALHDGSKEFYVGMVESNSFRLTRNSRFLEDNDIVKGAAFILRCVNNEPLFQRTPMKFWHEGMCCRCGRELTSDKWLHEGIGKKCLKVLVEKEQNLASNTIT